MRVRTDADSDGVLYGPRTAAHLVKHLGNVERELRAGDASRARSPENGPAASSAPPAGGQFALGGGRVAGKGKKPTSRRRKSASGAKKPSAPNPNLSFDGKNGTGYGIKGGDPRVRTLQAALNRLGLTDLHGQELAVDGRYGPRTTSSVKKLQKALGLPADGKVTPELLKRATELKQLPQKTPKQAAQKTRKRTVRPQPTPGMTRRDPPTRRSRILTAIARALGEHRIVDGVCVTCRPADAGLPPRS
jgi:hypothetical protein